MVGRPRSQNSAKEHARQGQQIHDERENHGQTRKTRRRGGELTDTLHQHCPRNCGAVEGINARNKQKHKWGRVKKGKSVEAAYFAAAAYQVCSDTVATFTRGGRACKTGDAGLVKVGREVKLIRK